MNNKQRDTQQFATMAPANDNQKLQMPNYEGSARRYLRLAEQCHRSSTDLQDQNFRRQWDRNLAHFNSEHANDSRFNKPAYANRNRVFRPKTRATALMGEAAMVKALFSTEDLVHITPEDDKDEKQTISAQIVQELMQFRLENTIPWYQTCVGAWQNAFNFSFCATYNYWDFETAIDDVPIEGALNEDGTQAVRQVMRIVKDEPCIDLLQPENFRFDSSADWRDVVGTSNFLERIVPLPLITVLERMESGRWLLYTEQQIIAASRGFDENESTRQAREGKGKQDPLGRDRQQPHPYQTVFCREYIVREKGGDTVFWTIGHQLLLSEPKPLQDVYFHGMRPFTVGYQMVEAHKIVPKSKNELISHLQEAINKTTNQRLDNVDLTLNKRYFLRRGQNIDVMSLMRNVPGGSIYMDDPQSDVKIVETPDVTQSSYEEQNRFSVEMDEVAGNFSTASVQSNRQLNETVGGMQLNRAASNELTEYAIMTFVKTWVEPTLKHLALLEQAYESDQVVMNLAAGKSEAFQRFDFQGDVPLQVLDAKLKVNVDVGIGKTDPTQRVNTLVNNVGNLVAMVPSIAPRLNADEMIKEVLGNSGRSDGQRFVIPAEEVPQQEDPLVTKVKMELEFKTKQLEATMIMHAMDLDQANEQFYAGLAVTAKTSMEKLMAEVGKSQDDTMLKKLDYGLKFGQQMLQGKELTYKMTTGNEGI